LLNLLETPAAECGSYQGKRGGTLGAIQFSHAESRAWNGSRREIGPALPLLQAVECQHYALLLFRIER
jgi:hypothetical protein